jgi:hypothetical protein
VAIALSGLIAIGLVAPTDVKLLAGLYAFGAMLAITIAHLSILRLRVTEPDRQRPFRVPWSVSWRGAQIPLPTLFAALLSALAFLSVLAFHDRARLVGGGWMLFGLVFYVVYRKVFEGTSLTRRVSVTERALTKQAPDVEYGNILVPVFGTELDDDIVATAGRLAAAEQEGDGEVDETHLAIVYVLGDEGAQGRRRNCRSGAARRRRSDRGRCRAAEPDPGRRDPWRDRRGKAGRDRRGDRVRAEEGALPGAPHRPARGRTGPARTCVLGRS